MTYARNEEEAREALAEYAIQQGIEHTAKEMLQDNLDTASIMKYMKLSAERIAELAKTVQRSDA